VAHTLHSLFVRKLVVDFLVLTIELALRGRFRQKWGHAPFLEWRPLTLWALWFQPATMMRLC